MCRDDAVVRACEKKDPEQIAPGQELQWYFWKSELRQRSVLIRCPAARCLGNAAVVR